MSVLVLKGNHPHKIIFVSWGFHARLDTLLLYPLTFIYISMGVTGTLGNVMVCTVIARNINMRTSTNFFLFSLAVADIAILIMGKSVLFWDSISNLKRLIIIKV